MKVYWRTSDLKSWNYIVYCLSELRLKRMRTMLINLNVISTEVQWNKMSQLKSKGQQNTRPPIAPILGEYQTEHEVNLVLITIDTDPLLIIGQSDSLNGNNGTAASFFKEQKALKHYSCQMFCLFRLMSSFSIEWII